jgi:lysophospholipase L1-like esterase
VGIHAPRRSTIAVVTAGALASTGTVVLGARNILASQAVQTRQVIPKAWDVPPRADGVYQPGGGEVERWQRNVPFDLHLMIFGDSTATGYGCTDANEVPGVLIARGVAEQSGKRIRLSTKAIVGATSKGLSGQVDAMFVAGPPPDAAVIMIGANDITALNSSGAVVVVGTCPDFGVITLIPQPLRWTARTLGLRLARAQATSVREAGGVPVPLADLLTPEFQQAPELMFSQDNYHPSAAGYALAAQQLLPALCYALGEWSGSPVPELPWESRRAVNRPLLTRLNMLAKRWPRRTGGVPAPLVLPSG